MGDHLISRCVQIVAQKPIKPRAAATAKAMPTATDMNHRPASSTTMHSMLARQNKKICLREKLRSSAKSHIQHRFRIQGGQTVRQTEPHTAKHTDKYCSLYTQLVKGLNEGKEGLTLMTIEKCFFFIFYYFKIIDSHALN